MKAITPAFLNEIASNQCVKRELDLTKTTLNEKTLGELVQALEKNSYIRSLHLAWSKLRRAHILILAATSTITALNVSMNELGEEETRILSNIKSLTHLDIHSNKIRNGGAKLLAEMALQSLTVSDNEIGNNGFKALTRNTTLTKLNVSSNGISDDGVEYLPTNTVLMTLDLSSNMITSKGAKRMATNKTLKVLNVSNNQIGYIGAMALANNLTLFSLSIFFNSLNSNEGEKIDKILLHRRMARENWLKLTPLLAFVRANQDNPFKNCILPLLPNIANLAGSEHQQKKPQPWVQSFMDTLFFKHNLKEKYKANQEVPPAEINAFEDSGIERTQKCLDCLLC